MRIEVLFDRDLDALEAEVPGGGARPWRALNPRRWHGEILVRRDGEYELRARAARDTGRFRYAIRPLADAPPLLTVRLPEGDVDLPAGGRVPYEVLGQDDLGLTELRLQTRRDPDAPWSDATLARFAGAPREIHVAGRWDAGPLGLLPGESADFRFQLFDDGVGAPTGGGSGRGVAVSRVFRIGFPSLAELYRDMALSQDSVGGALNAFTSKELTAFYCRVLNENLELASDLITDIFLNPSFPEDEIAREKQVICQEIAQVLGSVPDVIGAAFQVLACGNGVIEGREL